MKSKRYAVLIFVTLFTHLAQAANNDPQPSGADIGSSLYIFRGTKKYYFSLDDDNDPISGQLKELADKFVVDLPKDVTSQKNISFKEFSTLLSKGGTNTRAFEDFTEKDATVFMTQNTHEKLNKTRMTTLNLYFLYVDSKS